MLEVVAHTTSETNKTLLPICEHYDFMNIEAALNKTKSSQAKFQCVVKVEDDILSKFNKHEVWFFVLIIFLYSEFM